MRKLIVLTTALAGALLGTETVHAKKPAQAAGTFIVESLVPTAVEDFGDFAILHIDAVFVLDGSFQGDLESEFVILHLGPLAEPAPELFFADGRFTGHVNGAAGTLDYVFFGDVDAEGNADGRLIIRSGTGALSGVRSRLRLQGVTGVGGVYSGWIR